MTSEQTSKVNSTEQFIVNKTDSDRNNTSTNNLQQQSQQGFPPAFFTLQNPIHTEARAQRKRRRDRALANKVVTWRVYANYWRSSRHSICHTSLVVGITPAAIVLGLAFVFWGVEEIIETRDMFLGMSPTQLNIPVIVTGALFVVSGSLLFMSFTLHLKKLIYVSISGFVLSVGMLIFLVIWITLQTRLENLTVYLNDLVKSYRVTGKDPKTKLMNKLQDHLSCCGTQGPKDWLESGKFTTTVPASCCLYDIPGSSVSQSCNFSPTDPHWALQMRGCLIPLQDFLLSNDTKCWVYIAFGFLCVVVGAVLIALTLRHHYRRPVYEFLKPECRKLFFKLVDELMEATSIEDEEFGVDMRDFIKDRLEICRNMEEVRTLLATVAYSLHFVSHPKPDKLASYILQGKPSVVARFDKVAFPPSRKKTENKTSMTSNTLPAVVLVPPNSVEEQLIYNEPSPFSTGPNRSGFLNIRGLPCIVVPREVDKRMKFAELFLLDFNACRYKITKNRGNLKYRVNARFLSLPVRDTHFTEAVRYERSPSKMVTNQGKEETSVSILPKDLAEYRRLTFGKLAGGSSNN